MRSNWLRTVAVSLAAAATLGLAAMPAAQAAEPSPGEPGALIGGTDSTCFFYYGGVGQDQNAAGEKAYNIAYPDGHAVYWTAYFRRPAGSTLKLHGEYAHARYTSLVSYNAAGAILDGVNDEMINPDPGSVNPFRSGEARNASNRSYTVTVLPEKRPATLPVNHFAEEPARNSLYAAAPANEEKAPSGNYQTELVVLRVYVPDKGANVLGNVPMPEPELTLSAAEGGGTLKGQALCDKVDSQSHTRQTEGLPIRLGEPTALLLNKEIWHALSKPWELKEACNVAAQAVSNCPLPKNPFVPTELIQTPKEVANQAAFPATETEQWRGQFSRKFLLQTWTGEGAQGAETNPTKEGGGGFFPNIDNNYERDVLSRTFGKVVVAKGKLPTSPETFENNPSWPTTSSYQDRYTSYCMNESPRSTRVMNCKFDQEVPVNANREYTIAVSRAEDRPTNATRFCGVAWIEWSKRGDGEEAPYTNEEWGVLQMRTMLPSKSFGHAAQNVTKAGTDREVMGEYLPTVHYEKDASSFESSQGCSWANPGNPQLKAGSSSPNTGGFTLEWAPSREAATVAGVTYTLQAKDASGSWETVASGLSSPEYTFSSAPEGTWTYRVQAQGEGSESEYSGGSSEVKVDRSAPNAPSANPVGSPAYGSWFKDSVQVAFTANGDVALPDGSEGAGVNLASLSSPQTFNTSGSHTACGTVADVLGNLSAQGCATVQVDATAPSVQVTCPATAILRTSGITATVTASDGESGLAQNPSGTVPVSTSSLGPKTTTETAIDNVGHETSSSCTTNVVYAFSGLKPPAGKKVKAGKSILVGFNLKDALGYVTVGSGTLEVAPMSGETVGSYKPATSTVNTGDQFQAAKGGKYTYSLATSSLGKGTYSLRVTVSDGTVHTTSITLK